MKFWNTITIWHNMTFVKFFLHRKSLHPTKQWYWFTILLILYQLLWLQYLHKGESNIWLFKVFIIRQAHLHQSPDTSKFLRIPAKLAVGNKKKLSLRLEQLANNQQLNLPTVCTSWQRCAQPVNCTVYIYKNLPMVSVHCTVYNLPMVCTVLYNLLTIYV